MAVAVALEDVLGTQIRNELEGGAVRRTSFIETGEKDSPQAFLVEYDPNRHSRAHFHEVDQFQIVVEGMGSIGRHELRPYSVHFARAYTPYGPLCASAEGMTFITLRRRWDFGGAQRLPESKAVLEQVPNRMPWQVTERVDFDRLAAPSDKGVLVEAIPAVQDDEGLAGYRVSIAPNTSAYAPDPSRGDGQYVIVLEGSLLYGGKEHKALTIVSVEPHEGPFEMHAGAQGLKGLVLTFPRGEGRHAVAVDSADADFKTWQCLLCAFVYDEAEGLPEEGIAAGTRWEDVPENWSCPDCAATKSDFQMIEI